MVKNKKTLELKKHVATIHSTNKLTLLQRKISNALLYNAYDELLEKEEHEIHISALCKLIGYNSNDHKMIKKALVELLSTVLEWNLVDGNRLDKEESGVWNASSIIADASIDGPLCTYSYSNKMKKLLYRPELYGRLNMAVQAKFHSSYGLALYENCIRYQDIGQTPWFSMQKFRKLMGVEEGKYKFFRDLKLRVIDKALEEVNQYSSITVTLQLRKQGKQVIALQFLIQSTQSQFVLDTNVHASPSLSELLKTKFGLSKAHITEVLVNYSEEYIQEKVNLIESSSSFAEGKIHNLAKYLLSALKEDYQTVKRSEVKKPSLEFKKDKKLIEEVIQAYARYKSKQIDEALYQMEEGARQQFIKQFFEYAADSIKTILGLQRKKYNEKTILNSPPIKGLLRHFASENLPSLHEMLMPIEKFVESWGDSYQQAWQRMGS